MTHLLVSREYPPCTYPVGGIGTYVQHIARLLADHGETVHVIAEQWDEAPLAREVLRDGRLIVHRVPLRRPQPSPIGDASDHAADILDAMAASSFPAQAFSWQAALLAEHLINTEGIDVVEAQDYEAPLYYFLLRRATGLGPARCPPCFVHLHTTRELVCLANGWGVRSRHDLAVKRFEDATICGADALLSPSAFLAAHTERQYALAAGTIERIPYPIGDVPFVERDSLTWSDGAICYFGRFEIRKGVFEWMDAAVDAARLRPGLRFEFIGADTRLSDDSGASVRESLEARVPAGLESSFVFRAAMRQPELRARLAKARLVVVPSRWENFPNTCIEAMCSGLPVLASPHGGMAEMIDDGRTGWVAPSGQSADLAVTLARALATPAEELAAMGRAASASIRRLCDNRATVDRQLAFRQRLIAAGPQRSLRVPASPGWCPASATADAPDLVRRPSPLASSRAVREASDEASGVAEHRDVASGIAIVVQGVVGANLDACLATIASQTQPPVSVTVASRATVTRTSPETTSDHAVVADAVRLASRTARGVVVVKVHCRLDAAYVATCDALLASDPTLGVVTTWSSHGRGGDRMDVALPPALPWVWTEATDDEPVVIRTAALADVASVHEDLSGLPSSGALVLPVIAAGWRGATVPRVLVRRVTEAASADRAVEASVRAATCAETMRRHPELSGEAAEFIALVTRVAETDHLAASGADRGGFDASSALALARRAFSSPRYTADWLMWQVKRRLKR